MYHYRNGEKRYWMFDRHVGNPFSRFCNIEKWIHTDDLTNVIDIVMPPMDGLENKVWDDSLGLCYKDEIK